MKRLALVVRSLRSHVPARRRETGGRSTQPLQLVEATIDELQHALRTGLVTSEQLVRDVLGPHRGVRRCEAARQRVHPHQSKRARRGPRSATPSVVAATEDDSPLFGIPVLLKDNIDTADMPTTAGSVALEGSIPPGRCVHHAGSCGDAGAIILGKATLTEFANFIAIGMPSGYSSLGRYGFNPYDPRPDPRPSRRDDGRPVLTPGGSSSGSGIAVAANLVTVAVGTETSGSILSPGTANSIVGIKPTLGLVSRTRHPADHGGPGHRRPARAHRGRCRRPARRRSPGFDPADRGDCGVPDARQLLHRLHAVPQQARAARRAHRRAARPVLERRSRPRPSSRSCSTPSRSLRSEGAFVADPYEIPNQAAIISVRHLRLVPGAGELLDRADVRPEEGSERLSGGSSERAGPARWRHHRVQRRHPSSRSR